MQKQKKKFVNRTNLEILILISNLINNDDQFQKQNEKQKNENNGK